MLHERVLLTDLDGVLLDKERDWQQIEQVFSHYFPDHNPQEVRTFYRQHRGELHSADAAIEVGITTFGPDFWRAFYEADHTQALRPDWQALYGFCQEYAIDMVIFTEGSVGERPWSSEGYQPFKVKQLNLPMPARIYNDKVKALPQVVTDYHDQGVKELLLLDDGIRVLKAAADLEISTYLMEGICQPEPWLSGVVVSLTEMINCIPLSE